MTVWILELVPAPLTSPVITWTLYTVPMCVEVKYHEYINKMGVTCIA